MDTTVIYEIITFLLEVATGWIIDLLEDGWIILTRMVDSIFNIDFGGGAWVLLIVLVFCLSAFYMIHQYRGLA